MAPPFRVQPRAIHPGTHSRMPLTRYSESETRSTRRRLPLPASSCSAAMALARAMRLLVVSGAWM